MRIVSSALSLGNGTGWWRAKGRSSWSLWQLSAAGPVKPEQDLVTSLSLRGSVRSIRKVTTGVVPAVAGSGSMRSTRAIGVALALPGSRNHNVAERMATQGEVEPRMRGALYRGLS